MVDSDIIIWLLRGEEKFRTKFMGLVESTEGMMFITPVQIAEIHSGLRDKEIRQTEQLLDSFITIDVDKKIGVRSGELMREFRKSHNVTLADSIIAAAAIENGLQLWTLNRKHYPMIDDTTFVS